MIGNFPFNLSNSLIKLDISSNQFTGIIPDQFPSFNCCLQTFLVSFNLLVGNLPGSLFSCSALTYLKLNNNNFVGTLSDKFHLTGTDITVDVSFNQLTGLIPYSLLSLPGLRTLSAQNNLFTGFNGSFNTVPYLRIANNQLSGIVNLIRPLYGIDSVTVKNNALLGGFITWVQGNSIVQVHDYSRLICFVNRFIELQVSGASV